MARLDKSSALANASRFTGRRYVILVGVVAFIVLIYTSVRSSRAPVRITKVASGYHIGWGGQGDFVDSPTLDNDPSQNRKTSEYVKLQSEYHDPNVDAGAKYTSTIVLGRREKELQRVQWVYDELSNITSKIVYIVDNDQTDEPHLNRNHGREAMVYLMYIIDNYDNLNDITFFWHSDKKVWHNNLLLGESSVQTINRMDRDYIMKQGYVPSRCDLWPGCPSWVKLNPSHAEHMFDEHRVSDMFNSDTFARLFPEETEFPLYFAETCCSQFAVSRETIRAVPRAEYERIRDWVDEWWSDQYTGMTLEYLWQYIWLRKGENCPSMQECYCRTYGLCLEDRKDLNLLERWNSHRTRAEEYQTQEWQRAQYVRAHSTAQSDEERDREVSEDQERVRLEKLRDQTRVRHLELKAQVIKHWDLPESEVGW